MAILAKSIRSDLYSVDDGLSETVVYERINIENRIQTLRQLITAVDSRLDELKIIVFNNPDSYVKLFEIEAMGNPQ